MTNLRKSMAISIGSEISDVGIDLSEAAVDAVLNDGFLKDIPIIGSIVGIAKAGIAVRDQIYIRKLLKFLSEFNKIDKSLRLKFINDELSSEPKCERFGETILSLIDKAEADEKLILYAQIFKFYFLNNCKYEEAIRLCLMVEKSFYSDLLYLIQFEDHSLENQLVTSELYKNGFLSFGGIDGGTCGGILFTVNKFGEYLKAILPNITK